MKKTAAIIVTYNRLELLKECIESISNQKEQISHIVIVNNVSTDGTKEYLDKLKGKDKKIIVKHSEKNLGGAGGFALGTQIAVEETNDDYFWILDDDTIPNENTLSEFYNAAENLNQNFGFLCSNVRWTDGTSCNRPLPSGDWPEKTDLGLVKVEQATFVSIFLKRELVKKVGLPIAEMFIWGDDTEYTCRLNEDAPSYSVLNSTVIHKTPNNLSGITIMNSELSRVDRYFYLYRNVLYITRKYKTNKAVIKMIIGNILLTVKTLFNSKNRRFKRASLVLRGTFSGIFFNPKIKKV